MRRRCTGCATVYAAVCVPPCVLVPLCATGCVCLVRVGLSRPWVCGGPIGPR